MPLVDLSANDQRDRMTALLNQNEKLLRLLRDLRDNERMGEEAKERIRDAIAEAEKGRR